MEISTAFFGTVSYSKNELIHFVEGIIGFPQWKDYLPLPFDAESDQMLCLQSAEEEGISFIVMNPFLLLPDYHPVISGEDMKLLKCDNQDDLSFYTIAVIRDPLNESTVNLKCPIVVNSKNRLAVQVILEDSSYTLRHPLKSMTGKEA